jgi:hypothetical protein
MCSVGANSFAKALLQAMKFIGFTGLFANEFAPTTASTTASTTAPNIDACSDVGDAL